MSKLFSPLEIQGVTLKNRIVMSPMCMYSSLNKDGMVTPFHMTHYISRAAGQVGLVMVEATAVQPEGRISPQDLGIWGDQHIEGFKLLNEQIKSYGAKSSIQLAHAGRKAVLDSNIYAPSPIAFNESFKKPNEMSISDIKESIEAFKHAARRAKDADFDIIEIHAAHGYLINQFLSPLTNKRQDQYGGSIENRYRFLSEILTAVQSEWDNPIFVRISTDEYNNEGNSLEDILYFTSEMKKQGVALIDCSSGGVVPAKINPYPGYQIKRCETIKSNTEILTGAVGLITTGIQAEEILQNERADLIFIGRALLRNPYWAKQVADELNETIDPPTQYIRGWR
ncbi:NADPH dehydrogenase NamA [Ornithinibacillus halophilus]|uniref:NADPH2 dehydrogenase n=1 Tax=Ornithinibacillus halophilus TaxID=930117 RepID=A0A1M5CVP1_9BACI|nr:NADPH dehydrogenase NamA [Ornithinibacillus halophilus]SHF58779.1 NADPH2 dehydrogenase [Ornithinibacillus halophilus]